MNNCGCCCTNTLGYCNQNICGDGIDFDIVAQADGEYTLATEFLGITIHITKTFAEGEEIIFPIDSLNEGYQYTVELFDPTGAKVLISKTGVNYDCFKFRTVINKTIEVAAEESGS